MAKQLSFFEDEVRDGFYIPTAVKQAWNAGLDILEEIDRICRKHGIEYFAAWGTLIAAIRHGGFIPWDDDIDICMKRQDYEKFKIICRSELKDGFATFDYSNQDDHWYYITRVVNTQHMNFSLEHLNEYYNFPYIACVDVFLLDYLYKDSDKEKKRDEEIKYIIALADSIYGEEISEIAQKKLISDLEKKYQIEFENFFQLDKRQKAVFLYSFAEKQMARVKEKDSEKLGYIFPWVLKGSQGIDKTFYEKSIRVPYEMTTIPVPIAYQSVLESCYGNYLAVQKAWGGHGYPFFEGQRKELQKIADFKLPEFTFDKKLLPSRKKEGINSLEELKRYKKTSKETSIIRKALFVITYKKSVESISKWIELLKKNKIEISIIFAPTYRKDALGNILTDKNNTIDWSLDEKSFFTKKANIIEYKKAIEDDFFYDYIFIQNPYDGENSVLSIPESFYSKNLYEKCKKLIYIQPFEIEDFGENDLKNCYNMKHYVTAPAVLKADEVYVNTEKLREMYVKKLTEFAGREYKGQFEEKVISIDMC